MSTCFLLEGLDSKDLQIPGAAENRTENKHEGICILHGGTSSPLYLPCSQSPNSCIPTMPYPRQETARMVS